MKAPSLGGSNPEQCPSNHTLEIMMKKGYGWYFLLVGIFGLLMAFARAKNEREVFLLLATIPTAFLVVRGAEFLRKRNNK
jgi:succinate-acetate transporter protein